MPKKTSFLEKIVLINNCCVYIEKKNLCIMEEMKVCPFCGKEILAVAKMCKYCREWLPEDTANVVKPVET